MRFLFGGCEKRVCCTGDEGGDDADARICVIGRERIRQEDVGCEEQGCGGGVGAPGARSVVGGVADVDVEERCPVEHEVEDEYGCERRDAAVVVWEDDVAGVDVEEEEGVGHHEDHEEEHVDVTMGMRGKEHQEETWEMAFRVFVFGDNKNRFLSCTYI